MKPTLVALHGYTMNGVRLRALAPELFRVLDQHVQLVIPDAPHVCTPEAARDAFTAWRIDPPAPPHLRWWRASDDGTVYEGWQTSLTLIRNVIPASEPCGLLGFSQGALFGAALAALSARAQFPELRFVILVAGAVPRALDLQPLFAAPIPIPSLHVWGERDALMSASAPQLAARFDSAQGETLVWPGSHTIPPDGGPARRVIEYVLAGFGLAGIHA